jgi:hypothetical protein
VTTHSRRRSIGHWNPRGRSSSGWSPAVLSAAGHRQSYAPGAGTSRGCHRLQLLPCPGRRMTRGPTGRCIRASWCWRFSASVPFGLWRPPEAERVDTAVCRRRASRTGRTSDPELVQPGVVHIEHARCPLGRDPVGVGVVEVVPPRSHLTGQRLHVGTGQPTPHVPPRRPQPARLHVLAHVPPVAGQDAGSFGLPYPIDRRLRHRRMVSEGRGYEQTQGLQGARAVCRPRSCGLRKQPSGPLLFQTGHTAGSW